MYIKKVKLKNGVNDNFYFVWECTTNGPIRPVGPATTAGPPTTTVPAQVANAAPFILSFKTDRYSDNSDNGFRFEWK